MQTPTWGNMCRVREVKVVGSALYQNTIKIYVVNTQTRCEWFEIFMRGNNLQIGVVRQIHYDMSGEALHSLL